MRLLALEKCTMDEAKNPPLVLAALRLDRGLFEGEITKESTSKRGDDPDKWISILPAVETTSKADSKTNDALRKGAFHEKAHTADKGAKPKKEKNEKITAEKSKTETTFHVLLENMVKINSQNDAGVTALHVACKRGMIGMVKRLLQHKDIDVNKKDGQKNIPLHAACLSGIKDIVLDLIDARANIMEENANKMTPLHVAVVEQKLEIVKLICVHDNKKELLQRKEKDGNPPLFLAVKSQNEEMVKFFMDNEASLIVQNDFKVTVLHLAASLNCVNIMKVIFSSNPSDASSLLEEEDPDGCTPLHYAAKYNRIEPLEFLLNK